MKGSFDIGPFHLYRADNGTLNISLRCMADWAFGWEYGWRDDMRCSPETPVVEFRIGKLMIAYLSFFDGGCEVWLMGFWAFPRWKETNWRTNDA